MINSHGIEYAEFSFLCFPKDMIWITCVSVIWRQTMTENCQNIITSYLLHMELILITELGPRFTRNDAITSVILLIKTIDNDDKMGLSQYAQSIIFHVIYETVCSQLTISRMILIIISKLEVWPNCHCLDLGNEQWHTAPVCLSIFLWEFFIDMVNLILFPWYTFCLFV